MNWMGFIFAAILCLYQYQVATGEGEEESLQEHNRLRSLHGCPALKLSASLSKGCAEYAQVSKCAKFINIVLYLVYWV